MTRAGSAWSAAGGALAGFVVGLVGSRLATMHVSNSSTRANIVLGATVATTVAGAGIASYATTKNLQLTP